MALNFDNLARCIQTLSAPCTTLKTVNQTAMTCLIGQPYQRISTGSLEKLRSYLVTEVSELGTGLGPAAKPLIPVTTINLIQAHCQG